MQVAITIMCELDHVWKVYLMYEKDKGLTNVRPKPEL